MFWRTTRKKFAKNSGEGNKRAIKDLVFNGKVPGLIFFLNGKPVAWCSIAPREDFTSLERSKILKRVNDKNVWSIIYFFIHKQARSQSMHLKTIKGAVQYAKIIEAYSINPKKLKSSFDPDMGFFTAS